MPENKSKVLSLELLGEKMEWTVDSAAPYRGTVKFRGTHAAMKGHYPPDIATVEITAPGDWISRIPNDPNLRFLLTLETLEDPKRSAAKASITRSLEKLGSGLGESKHLSGDTEVLAAAAQALDAIVRASKLK